VWPDIAISRNCKLPFNLTGSHKKRPGEKRKVADFDRATLKCMDCAELTTSQPRVGSCG
jgi:hypothetical protein